LVGTATDEAGVFLITANVLKLSVFSIAPSGVLTAAAAPSSASALALAAFPAKTCSLGQTAAARAKSLLHRPYFLGAKGYDMSLRPIQYISGDTLFNGNSIPKGYEHCDGTQVTDCSIHSTLPGIDCSGLILWSYDTAAGALATDNDGNALWM
jgi:cell wall-associated NlpC family hydrolase